MQSTVFFILAVVAFASAKQLKVGPQTFTETASSSKENNKRYATQEFALYLTPSELKALEDSKSANNEAKGQTLKEQPQYVLQSYNQPDVNDWAQYTKLPSIEQSQGENKDFASQDQYLFNSKPVFENQENDRFNYYGEQKSAEQQGRNAQQGGNKKNFEWIQYNPVSKDQEESLIHEELQQQWSRILEHNRGQLKSLSFGDNDKQKSEEQGSDKKETEWIQYNPLTKEQEESRLHEDLQQQWNRILEHNRGQLKSLSSVNNNKQNSEERGDQKKESEWLKYNPLSKAQEEWLSNEELQKQWNRILENNRGQIKTISSEDAEKKNNDAWANKDSTLEWQSTPDAETRAEIEKEIEFALKHQAIQFGQENFDIKNKANIEKTPLLIHKEVKITKHLPVHVVKNVKVPVPTPVLVPVPEPYEVKVPHPYPVPYEVIKHIPVPVIKNH